ncbi:hypothetical protein ACEPPN_019159 [Leptodophora sp. 'Broadleaf-Isolate-01']
MYHRKRDDIVLPIRRRVNATSLRERFLDSGDSPSISDRSRRKLPQLDLADHQSTGPKQQLKTPTRNSQQGSATSQHTIQNGWAASDAHSSTDQDIQSADAALRFEEPQDPLFRGRKLNLSGYKERQLKKLDLRQARHLPSPLNLDTSPDKDVGEDEIAEVEMIINSTSPTEAAILDFTPGKKLKDYPSAWGGPSEPMRSMKRLLFDGPREGEHESRAASQKGIGKEGRDRQSRSRDTTPSIMSQSDPEETAYLRIPLQQFQTDEGIDNYGSGNTGSKEKDIPTSNELEALVKRLGKLVTIADARGAVSDRGMRTVVGLRKDRLEEIETERRDAERKEYIRKS